MTRRIALVFVVLFLAVQLALPVLALFGERPGRFGWHMYSAVPDVPEAWIVRPDGTRELVTLEEVFAAQRAEIDFPAALLDLCDRPGVHALYHLIEGGADVQEVPCD